MLVVAIILALYFWTYFANTASETTLPVINRTTAIAAAIAFLVGLASYLWTPKKYIFWGSYVSFIVLGITSGVLILNTGGSASPFVALWMVIALFAGVFGYYGLIPLFIAITAYLLLQFTNGNAAHKEMVTLILAGELPLILSYVIWRTQASNDNNGDRAYRELATELSQVAGKSEVVINAIADGVVALNSQGVIQLINPAAQQIIGWGKQDALALNYKSVLKLVDTNDKELDQTNDPILQVSASNKEMRSTSLSLLTNSGKKLLISIVVSPIGQPGSGVIVVFRDITKEKAEEREQAEFISTASHEMRTPVAAIEGYLGLALNPATAQIDEKARDFINKAHLSAQHLGRLFQDLLDVTKADDGRMSNNPKVVDVVAFTHDIVQGLRHKAEEKGLRVLFKPQPDDGEEQGGERRLNPVFYANIDNDHLGEILSNLVENAIKYTFKGDVTIDINGDNEHVVISIADSGIGIPKEDQVHLFQKFYRVDNSDTREIGGTGLGLYLCRRLAEAMGGRIWLDSEYKRGSTFYLEVPRIDHEEATRLIESASTERIEISDVTASPSVITPEPVTLQPFSAPTTAQDQQVIPGEAVYTNAPAAAVAQQLQTMGMSSMQQPVQLPNTPISSIEQHPDQYTRQRQGPISIPPRDQN